MPALFANFVGTTSESAFSNSYIIGFGSHLPDADRRRVPPPTVKLKISRFPRRERACMPGSTTTPGRPSACAGALRRLAFRYTDSVGTQNQFSIAAQWLACTYPCRRFAHTLTDACARLGADVVRYSFIAGDLHPLLLAGLPAHLCKNSGKRWAQIFFPTEALVFPRGRFTRAWRSACSRRFFPRSKSVLLFLHSLGPRADRGQPAKPAQWSATRGPAAAREFHLRSPAQTIRHT